MGCLIELIFDFFITITYELIATCYIKLMTLIVPDKKISERTRKTIKNISIVFSAVLWVALIIAPILLIQDEPVVRKIGKYSIITILCIITVQIIAGIIIKTVNRKHK